MNLSGIFQGSIAFFSTLLAVPLLITSFCIVFLRLFPDAAGAHDTTSRYLQLGGFVALTIAIGVVIYGALRNRMSIEEATFGGLLWWLVGMVLTSLFLQSGSYLFTWPLLLMLLAQVWLFVSKHRSSRAVYLVLLSAGLFLSIVLWVPFIFHASIAVNLMLYGLVMSVLVFVTGLFLPLVVQLLPQKS